MGLRVDRQHVLWNQLPCTVILASSRINHLRCWAAAGQDICAGVGQRGGWGISLELQKFCPLPPPGQSCGGSAAVREQSQVRLPAQQEEGRGGVLFKPYFFVSSLPYSTYTGQSTRAQGDSTLWGLKRLTAAERRLEHVTLQESNLVEKLF